LAIPAHPLDDVTPRDTTIPDSRDVEDVEITAVQVGQLSNTAI